LNSHASSKGVKVEYQISAKNETAAGLVEKTLSNTTTFAESFKTNFNSEMDAKTYNGEDALHTEKPAAITNVVADAPKIVSITTTTVAPATTSTSGASKAVASLVFGVLSLAALA
jgi:hypothetical protein